MKLFEWLTIFKWVRVIFGKGHLDRLILFECKYLFSIYFNSWETIEHDRFHRHAFASVSVMLYGSYDEEQLHDDGSVTKHILKAPYIRIIPRTNNHRMLLAKEKTYSITIAGPWDRIWTETLVDGTKRYLTWGRKIV